MARSHGREPSFATTDGNNTGSPVYFSVKSGFIPPFS
jgi:hypothetical protein